MPKQLIYTLFPYTTLFRSGVFAPKTFAPAPSTVPVLSIVPMLNTGTVLGDGANVRARSEEHTSEIQSQFHLVCRLLLEKKKKHNRSCRHKHRMRARRTNSS